MTQPRPALRIGYVAAGLIFAHAALSAYWAAGGSAFLGLLSEGIREMADARETWFVALVWGVALLKALVGFLALRLALQGQSTALLSVELVIVAGAGLVLTVYGGIGVLGGLAVLAGMLAEPEARGREFWAYLLLWSPWWLAIGVTHLALAWISFQNRSEPVSPDNRD